ncbi:hypothetical protein VTO42DRAFT_7486 [Malbranchea cinnamomea]
MTPSKLSLLMGAALGLSKLSLADGAPTTTTVSLLEWIGTDGRPVGSVVNVAPSATTYHINCIGPEDMAEDETDEEYYCGTFTIAQGPSTYSMHVSWYSILTSDIACDLTGTTRAECTASLSHFDESAGLTSITTTTMTLSEELLPFAPVTITAGVEKLNAPATATTGATPTATGGTLTGASTAAQPSETGGAALTNSRWGFGGAAAIAAVAIAAAL